MSRKGLQSDAKRIAQSKPYTAVERAAKDAQALADGTITDDAVARASARIRASRKQIQAMAEQLRQKAGGLGRYDIEPNLDAMDFPLTWQGIEYARAVVAGRLTAGLHVQQACTRFLEMLEDPRFVFRWGKAERACRFVQQMPHAKGTWYNADGTKQTTIVLVPWQCWVLISIFGFYWAHNQNLRVVHAVYIEIPRKNAKSTLAAAVGLYMLTEDGEQGAEVYSAATTHKQALAVFDTARNMAIRQLAWKEHHGVTISKMQIALWGTATKFEALHAQGETLDGLNVYCALIDELHAHKTRAVYDVLETATGSRRNPLLFNITTAGTNRAGICYEVRGYVLKLLARVADDPTFFGVVYTLDEDDDWTDPQVWAKANPNLDVSVSRDELARLCEKAKTMASAQNNFLTKHLNVWVNAGVAWMSMPAWEKMADPSLTLETFRGEDCVVGNDLASRTDIASSVAIFRRTVYGQHHYYAIPRHYLPSEAATAESEDKVAAYPGWVKEGRIITTPGEMLNLDMVEQDLRETATIARVKELAFDPYQAAQMMGHLQQEGFTVVEVRPTILNFSQPMKELEALVLSGRFHHNGCPVLEWMVSNVVCHTDQKDNIYPRKEFAQNKIDGVIAMLMALNRWLSGAVGPRVVSRGFETI